MFLQREMNEPKRWYQAMIESTSRSLVKAVSWRLIAVVVTSLVAWALTSEFTLAATIGVLDSIIKIGAYFFHERLWNRVSYGKIKSPEYEI